MCFRPAAIVSELTCPECGASNRMNAYECVECGASLDDAVSASRDAAEASMAGAPGMPASPGAPGMPASPGAPGAASPGPAAPPKA